MSKLIITRGIPGSGKSTYAHEWVAEDPQHRARINRDDLRMMAHAGFWDGDNTEKQITAIRDQGIRILLNKGIDVINDDTNLPSRTVRDLRRLATLTGAEFEIHDMTDTPLEVCLLRDEARLDKDPVGEKVIRGMYDKFVRGKPYPLPVAEERKSDPLDPVPYTPPPGKPKAIIVDIDGTVARMVSRGPYDESRVNEDQPNWPVVFFVLAANEIGAEILFVSGRHAAVREATLTWLDEHVPVTSWSTRNKQRNNPDEPEFDEIHTHLYMRATGDNRPDYLVKLEIFNEHIRDEWNIIAVLDDRDQVVEMWRSMGLACLQVAEGNF